MWYLISIIKFKLFLIISKMKSKVDVFDLDWWMDEGRPYINNTDNDKNIKDTSQ